MAPGRRRARALVELARRAQGDAGRPAVSVTIPVERLADEHATRAADIIGSTTGSGATRCRLHHTHLRRDAVERLTCDAALTRLLTHHGAPLDVGRATRIVPPQLRAALVQRDKGCAFPHCDRPPGLAHAHHIVHWSRGGPTSLENLVLVCSHHHHAVHDRGWSVTRRPDGTLDWRPPGSTHPPGERPPPAARCSG